ncbi:hypothetical protein KC363_g6188 [Hortaea werneckii]|uniref:J domain-containing protein n=1 Tax=Hortaea werneckii TaxID=91943 RepID=A0A3M7EXW5_HORWE|nr:hypothetical protein KC363_g6188 [Hortaea werneckii]RMY81370.1 hypothetical protein D0861_08339 [Hortaea werneckii]
MSEKKSSQPNGNNAHHTHHDGSSGRAYTVEQKAAVLRVRKCGTTAFYDILGLESVRTTCSDSDIKKAYRKLSLLTHPDKNGYEGADEAFKMVSRAFQILSDADKKARYDKFGGDPESRFGGGGGGGGGGASASGASPFAGFGGMGARPRGAGGPVFEEEISPEELFRQFFGGGMGGPFGGPFGGGMFASGPGFATFGGGPGIRIHQFGGARPRRRPHNHADTPLEPQSILSALQSLMPLLLLFLLPLLSSLFSGATSPSGPNIRLHDPKPPFTETHLTHRLNIPYYVNPVDVQDFTAKKWKDLDLRAERQYMSYLSSECDWEQGKRQQLANEAQGFFFTDMEKLDRARKMKMPACQKLNEIGGRGGGNRVFL